MSEQYTAERWCTNENFLLRTIAGESMLIPVGEVHDPRFDNCMISVNETTAFLWEFFSGQPRTEAEAVDAAEEAFDAPPGMIAADIHEFITAYFELGLLHKEE